jgi:phosphatidylserine/phosphatidylglycerophosphate/cardiolipin synthase-like enzyme
MDKLNVVCATQLKLPFGMQLWGVGEDGLLYSTLQKTPSTPWGKWSACSGAPQQIIALTAAPARNGLMSLWALTADHRLHCWSQIPGGKWGAWSDPNSGWWNAPELTCICAGLMGWIARGRILWGVGVDGQLWLTWEDPGIAWSKWYTWADAPKGISALATAVAGYGCMSLWALTTDHVLYCKSQPTFDGSWDPWTPGWWYSAPPTPALIGICASMQGGQLGRAIWGIGKDGHLYWTYETAQQGGGWTTDHDKNGNPFWPPFLKGAPREPQGISSLCAARGNDGRVALWALSQDKLVHNTIQTTAGGLWNNWDAGGTQFSPPSLLDEIVGVIERGDPRSDYRGVTYHATSHNTFTLLDTPRLWDKSLKAPVPDPIPACEDLLDKIADTIGQARTIVDIALMNDFSGVARVDGELPSGGFQKALSRGFRSLVKRKSSPLVRITIGITTPAIITSLTLKNWVKATIEHDGGKLDDVTFTILIGGGKETGTSWNHSKIVAADGVRAVVGGHNPWATQYLGARPVHDVSGLFEGSVVLAVHRFCDQLWTNHGTNPFFIPGAWVRGPGKGGWKKVSGKISRPEIGSPTPKGNTRMLALGRLGDGIVNEFTVATNASVSARIIALCRAKSKIRISQQSLYNSVAPLGIKLTMGFDFYTLWAIIKAVQAGVKVEIVITNDLGWLDGGYEAFLQKVVDSLVALQIADCLSLYPGAVSPSREDHVAWASASLKPPAKDIPLVVSKLPTEAQSERPLAQLKANLTLAQLYYAPDVNYWQVGDEKKNAANHAKVYIIDDTHFYVGSDNMYLSASAPGHQEYGYLIEGQPETKEIIVNYWEKLWKNSKKYPVPIQFPKNRRQQLWKLPGPKQ